MAYAAYDLICRRCAAVPMKEDELAAYLDRFVNELETGEKVDEETYRVRMEACASCPNRAEVTCVLCGCFCQARAAMRRNRCPIPGDPRWTEK